jgi:DNA-binding beta-propeller fold protein YncE
VRRSTPQGKLLYGHGRGVGSGPVIRWFVVLVCCGAWLGLSAPAFGSQVRHLLFSFGGEGSGAGQFSQFANVPSSPVAVNQSSGDVYVGDPGGNRVEMFDAAGHFVLMFGGAVDKTTGGNVCTVVSGDTCGAGVPDPSPSGPGHGFFGTAAESVTGVAVDQSTGDVFVADRGARLVERFGSQGGWLGQFTAPSDEKVRGGSSLAVDSLGNVYVADGNGGCGCVQKFDSAGVPDPTTPEIGAAPVLVSAFAVAVDSANNLYVVDRGAGVVQKFDSSGTLVSSGNYALGLDAGGSPAGVAVDPSTNNVYVLDDGGRTVLEYDSSGNLLSSVPPQSFSLGSSRGIAFDTFSGDLLVTDGEHDLVGGFGAVVTLPTVTTGAASGVGTAVVTLAGVVNPSGVLVTSCEFEYGTSKSYGQTAACSPSPGSGSSDVSVTAEVTGLSPDTTYHFRLVARNTTDKSEGADETFTTHGKPTVDEESTAGVGAAGAKLQAQVNPHGFETEYHFEYGTSAAYGSTAPVPDGKLGSGTADEAAAAEITGLQHDTTYHYRVVGTSSQGTVPGPDETFTTLPPAQLRGEGANGITQTSATLEGIVIPDGVQLTDCHFDYGTTEAYGQTVGCTPAAGSIPPDLEEHTVTGGLTGLQAGSTYHFRLVVTDGQGTVTGGDREFPTVPPAQIESVSASDLTAESATLHAQINPLGSETTYHFEYGTSTSYGSSIPEPEGKLGAGSTPVAVTAALPGPLTEKLTANTTYHYRVVAVNTLGTARSPDHTFIYTTAGGGLPDHRAYELVTPPEKNAALIGATFSGFRTKVSEDGSRMMAASIQCFAGSRSCVGARSGQGALFEFARTATGWVTSPLSPPADQFETSTGWAMNPNTAGTALFSGPTTAGGPDHLLARAPDGSFAATGPTAAHEVGASYFQPDPLVSTLDLSHIVYGTNLPEWPPSFDAGHEGSLYEYTSFAQKEPILVGVTGGAGSHDLISVCGTEFGGGGGAAVRAEYGSLASDGRTVYFTAKRCKSGSGANEHTEVPADELYARIDQSRTVKVSERVPASCSKPACVGSPPANAAFQGASGDGTRVLFTSTQQLTDEATEDPHSGDSATVPGCPHTAEGTTGCNLYESECPDHCEDPSQRQVIDVSAGDTSGGGPRVQGVVAIAPDGSHVYFVARGVLTGTANSQGQKARGGGDNLYMFSRSPGQQGGQIAFVATLLPSDLPEWEQGVGKSNVTPEGRFLVFTSHAALTGDDSHGEGPAQVFRYDSGSGVLVRVSVGDRGFNDNGNVGVGDASIVPAGHGFIGTSGPARADPTMSHDGSYVFFSSPIGLTPGALNDARVHGGNSSEELANNVYEYHEGRVYLISDGKDVSAAGVDEVGSVELVGSDATGANVFFTTTDRLVPQDTDTQRDFYDARIGGGFPYTPPPQPCGEQSCRGTLPSGAPAVAPGSSTFSGAGNLESPAPVPQVKGKPPTRAQLLAKALKSCHTKRNKQKRTSCEREARKRYGTKARTKAKKGGK